MTGELLDMACRSCGGRRVELFLDLGDQPHCNRLIPPELEAEAEPKYALRVGFCHDCTLVQIDYTIPKEQMFSRYPYVSGTTRTLPAHFADTAGRLTQAYGVQAGDLLVDIGSNDGTALKQYRPYGMRLLGVEPAANVAELATQAGVPTLTRFFNEGTASHILETEGPAKLVTAAGVFFHLEELHSVCRGIKAILAPDGVFCVQAIYLGGMLENTAFDQVYHEHLCYYTLTSLQGLLAPHGLEVFKVSVVPIHGGTLEAHVGHPGAHPIDGSVSAMAQTEDERGYGRLETYQVFAERVWKLRDALISELETFRREHQRVYSYGAPAKGATLLNSFGIDTRYVQFAAEKSALKFDHLIPGVRIPIKDEATLAPPDVYLVLAWNFLEEFLDKERAFLQGGGRFLVPVPYVRVIGAEGA